MGYLEVEFEPEDRALAGHAGHPDTSAHEFDDALGDGEPQARAAAAASTAAIHLGKWLEEPGDVFGADAGAGVLHLEAQPGAACYGFEALHTELDAALVGELDGVADQVHEHLAQAAVVAFQCLGNFRNQFGR